MKRSRLIVLICGTIICLCAKATDITTLSFSQPTSLPTGYVYSSSGSPTIATVENTSCVYLTNGGGTQVPSFNSDGSVSSSNGKRWMAFSPSVDCSVVVRIYSSKKVFTLYGKNGTVATFTQAAKQWDDWNITGLKGGEWYVIGAGNSQCYVSSMTFTASGPVISSDATLSALTYNGISVPNFSANTLSYEVELPAGTTAIPTLFHIAYNVTVPLPANASDGRTISCRSHRV